MTPAAPIRVDGDGRVSVSLAELLALRARVGRVRALPQHSRALSAGQQFSRLYGRGMDYAESRIYQPGDDVRRLDWRLTARSGALHTKLFQEEREGRLLILLDTHASMHFGTRARLKSVQAARAAALAGWYAANAGERVGAMAFGPCRRMVKPQGGVRGALALCGALADWDAHAGAGDEPLSEALGRAGRLHGANRVLLVSDGLSCDDAARGRLREVTRHATVAVLVVADVLELEPPPPGRYPLEHAGERREVSLQGTRERQQFQQVLGAGQKRLVATAQALGLRWRSIDTAADPLAPVGALLGVGTAR